MSPSCSAWLRGWVARGALLAVVAVVCILGWQVAAVAHPALLYTAPAAETADPVPPAQIVLVFGEPVSVAPDGLSVAGADGQLVPLNPPGLAKDGHAVTASVPQTLTAGVYTVSWRVTGADGDLVEGRFRFAVGTSSLPGSSTVDGVAGGDPWPVTVLRFSLLAGLTLAAGGLIVGLLIRRARTINPSLPQVDSLASLGAIAGAAAAAALSVRYATQTGEVDGPATLAAVQAAAFVVIVIAQALRRNGITVIALIAITVAEALRAHPHTVLPGGGAVLTYIHVTAAAVWAGTLLHVIRASRVWRAHPAAVRWLLHTYARFALWAAATVVITGCVTALLLAPPATWTTTTYGRLLIAKTTLVAAAITFAILARRTFQRADKAPWPALRPAKSETVTLTVVLVATAALTTAAPPASDPAAGQPLPPAAVGQVVPLGTLAGQVGVAIEASQGRLVVRLAAPSLGDYYATTPTRQRYRLTGQLLTPENRLRELDFRGCGPGCFRSDVHWRDGDNLLTLNAQAAGWTGGTVTQIVSWPTTDGTSTLAQAVAAMRDLHEVRYSETVTSDTSQPTGEAVQLQLTAADFLTLQPYGTGQATHTALLPAPGGQHRLALGYPAEGRYIQLTLDSRYRIVDEIQAGAKHLTIRHYQY